MRPRNKNIEKETLAERRVRRELAARGKSAETSVQDVLSMWKASDHTFDYDRLLDSKAAGKIVAAQVSDYLLFHEGSSATLEVKRLKKGHRLSKGAFPQHPRMKRRELAGCKGFLLALTTEDDQWWVARVTEMEKGVPSWLLPEVAKSFETVLSALVFIKYEMGKE